MIERCLRALAAAVVVVLTPLAAAAQGPAAGTVPAGGEELAVPVLQTQAGPLFALAPVVRDLGGTLGEGIAGESYILELEGKKVILGAGVSTVTVDTEIVRLSQPPVLGDAGIYVPQDLLEHTFGDLLGYRFRWEPASGRLRVFRRTPRDLAVQVDVVHLQGVTTVVLQFAEVPRYRIDEQPDRVAVELIDDRFATPSPPRTTRDSLVRGYEVGRDRLTLDLAPGAGVESYTLKDPFRLVFDVHRGGSGEAAAEAQRPAPAPPVRGSRIETIVLDPGHGGSESGAVGPGGSEEKDITLALAQTLKARLERRLPVRVVLTRNEDAALPLDTRSAIANQNKADLFISLHLNSAAGPGRDARGAETYFLSLEASDERAAHAAATENQSPTSEGAAAGGSGEPPAEAEAAGDPLYDLQLILWDLAQAHHLAESQRLARLIQEELNSTLDLRDRGVKQAPFRVLMGAAMPAVLVELGFLSNPGEEKRLEDPAYRAQLADSLVAAIARYKVQVDGEEAPAAGAAPAAPGEPPP